MLNPDIANIILDGLFAMDISRTENGEPSSSFVENDIFFDGDIYLGLLTKMPKANGETYEDGSYFAEPSDPTYLRIKLNTKNRINKENFIAHAATGDVIKIDGDNAIPAYVVNQGEIMFPEASVVWEPVVGFGLFRSSDTSDLKTLPILWGTVTTESGEQGVFIDQYEVPIIKTGSFKVSLV